MRVDGIRVSGAMLRTIFAVVILGLGLEMIVNCWLGRV
jgi:hypothetical protein